MTNKPMLSVERKVIEDILADAREPGDDYMAARKVLRALLDKPACNHKACKSLGEPHPFCNFAMQLDAQHQGEPVYQLRYTIGSDRGWRDVSKAIFETSQNPCYESRKLYAEQPAPVAVVMPERRISAPHFAEWRIESDKGYNKALDDVARLNGVKPTT